MSINSNNKGDKSFLKYWSHIKFQISVTGSRGIPLSKVLEGYGEDKKQIIPRKIGLYIVKQLILSSCPLKRVVSEDVSKYYGVWEFKIKSSNASSLNNDNNVNVEFINSIFDNSEYDLSNIKCYPPYLLSLETYGVSCLEDIPQAKSQLSDLIEVIGSYKEEGCSIQQAGDVLGISKIHTLIDKAVNTGMAVKRIVRPIRGLNKNIVSRFINRTNIVHLKLFASAYKPEFDNVCFEADDSVKDVVWDLIVKILEENDEPFMPCNKLDNILGISFREMQILRVSAIAKSKKGWNKIKFYEEEKIKKNSTSDDEYVVMKWMCTLGDGSDDGDNDSDEGEEMVDNTNHFGYLCMRNQGLYNQALLLCNQKDGVTSVCVRHALGILPKRASRVCRDFLNVFNFPFQKIQSGKNCSFKIFGKQPLSDEFEELPSENIKIVTIYDEDINIDNSNNNNNNNIEVIDIIKSNDSTAIVINDDKKNVIFTSISEHKEGEEKIHIRRPAILTDLKINRMKLILDRLKYKFDGFEEVPPVDGVKLEGDKIVSFTELLYHIHEKEKSLNIDKQTLHRLLSFMEGLNHISILQTNIRNPFSNSNSMIKLIVLPNLTDLEKANLKDQYLSKVAYEKEARDELRDMNSTKSKKSRVITNKTITSTKIKRKKHISDSEEELISNSDIYSESDSESSNSDDEENRITPIKKKKKDEINVQINSNDGNEGKDKNIVTTPKISVVNNEKKRKSDNNNDFDCSNIDDLDTLKITPVVSEVTLTNSLFNKKINKDMSMIDLFTEVCTIIPNGLGISSISLHNEIINNFVKKDSSSQVKIKFSFSDVFFMFPIRYILENFEFSPQYILYVTNIVYNSKSDDSYFDSFDKSFYDSIINNNNVKELSEIESSKKQKKSNEKNNTNTKFNISILDHIRKELSKQIAILVWIGVIKPVKPYVIAYKVPRDDILKNNTKDIEFTPNDIINYAFSPSNTSDNQKMDCENNFKIKFDFIQDILLMTQYEFIFKPKGMFNAVKTSTDVKIYWNSFAKPCIIRSINKSNNSLQIDESSEIDNQIYYPTNIELLLPQNMFIETKFSKKLKRKFVEHDLNDNLIIPPTSNVIINTPVNKETPLINSVNKRSHHKKLIGTDVDPHLKQYRVIQEVNKDNDLDENNIQFINRGGDDDDDDDLTWTKQQDGVILEAFLLCCFKRYNKAIPSMLTRMCDQKSKDDMVAILSNTEDSSEYSQPWKSILPRDYSILDLATITPIRLSTTEAMNTPVMKNNHKLNKSKKRIVTLIRRFPTIRLIAGFVIAYRGIYLNQSLSVLLNEILNKNKFYQLQWDSNIGGVTALDQAAFTRVIQTYFCSNPELKIKSLKHLRDFPIYVIARVNRELCCNNWLQPLTEVVDNEIKLRGFEISETFNSTFNSILTPYYMKLLVKNDNELNNIENSNGIATSNNYKYNVKNLLTPSKLNMLSMNNTIPSTSDGCNLTSAEMILICHSFACSTILGGYVSILKNKSTDSLGSTETINDMKVKSNFKILSRVYDSNNFQLKNIGSWSCHGGQFHIPLNRIHTSLEVLICLKDENIINISNNNNNNNIIESNVNNNETLILYDWLVENVKKSNIWGLSVEKIHNLYINSNEVSENISQELSYKKIINAIYIGKNKNVLSVIRIYKDSNEINDESINMNSLIIESQHEYLYKLKLVAGDEGYCPWIDLDGNIITRLFQLLVSKIISILTIFPGSNFNDINASLPILSIQQTSILIKKLIFQELLYEVIPVNSIILADPFEDIFNDVHTVTETAMEQDSINENHLMQSSYFLKIK